MRLQEAKQSANNAIAVTELWFGFRQPLQSHQVRGLDQETAIEFCQRRYEMRGNLRMVEPKTEMKKRTKRSPDLADAAVVLAELFRQRGGLSAPQTTGAQRAQEQWQDLAKKFDLAANEKAYLVS